MILARESPVFPRMITSRRFSTRRLVRLVVLALTSVFFVPIPLSNIVPAVTIMLIALAYLEEDGVLLALSLTAAAAVLFVATFTIWQSVEEVRFMTS